MCALKSWPIPMICGLALCTSSGAQVFRLTAGASTGFQAQGAGLEVRGKGYEAWTGAGLSDGQVIFGSFLKLRLRNSTIKVGDDEVPMTLPIDSFGTRSTLHTYGISLDRQIGNTALHAFAGKMGSTFTSPMFRAGSSSGPLTGILFTDTVVTPNLHLFSRNILSSSQTVIAGVEWKPTGESHCLANTTLSLLGSLHCRLDDGYTISFAAGVGNGHLYTSQALAITRQHLDLNLAYVAADDGFQRSLSGTPLQSELDGANITGVFHPSSNTSFSFGHQNYLIPQLTSPPNAPAPVQHAQVDRISGAWKLGEYSGTALGSALFRSTVLNRTAQGVSLWVSQTLGPLDLRLNYLLSAASPNPATQSIALTSQEKLTPRISALQVTTFSAGKTSVAFGGSLLTNLLTVAVNYQTLYVPFRPDNPFTQALSVTVNINLHGNIHLSTATSFTPQGKIIYTLAGSGSYYRLSGLEAAPQLQTFHLQQYLINGQVTTDNGQPIYGAAIRVGKETLYSDRDGRFFARERKPGSYPIEVLLSSFIADGTFTVLSAPYNAAASKDADGPGITIVLKRSL